MVTAHFFYITYTPADDRLLVTTTECKYVPRIGETVRTDKYEGKVVDVVYTVESEYASERVSVYFTSERAPVTRGPA